MNDKTAEQFWKSVQNGDDSAFQQLYDRYADLLYSYGMKIIANEDAVTNAIQTLFIYIFDKRANLSCPNSIATYLCVSLKRLLIVENEREKKRSLISMDTDLFENYDFSLEVDTETSLIRTETDTQTLAVLQDALNGLSKQQREVIYLKYYKNLSNEEIAAIIGTTNQVIRNVASKALAKLRADGGLAKLLQLWLLLLMIN